MWLCEVLTNIFVRMIVLKIPISTSEGHTRILLMRFMVWAILAVDARVQTIQSILILLFADY